MAEELEVIKRCAACRKEKPVSQMKVCMHNQMHNYVCDSKCMNDFYNPPKKPAQLPSQGGEAVAVYQYAGDSPYRSWTDISKELFDEYAARGEWLTRTLYTHPADQVAEGVVVSRELLVRLLDEGRRAETWAAQDELRQLLAKGEGVRK